MSASSSEPAPVPAPAPSASAPRAGSRPWLRALVLAGIFVAAFVVLSVATGALHHTPQHSPDGWFTSHDAALAAAKQQRKPVFLDFSQNGCPPCQALDEETFPDPAVAKTLRDDFISAHINLSVGSTGDLVQRYWLNATPTLIVLDPDGKIVSRSEGFKSPQDMLIFLRDAQAKMSPSSAATPTVQSTATQPVP